MTYFAGLPAHPLVIHAAVVLIPLIALLVAALPFFAAYRARFAQPLLVAAAFAVALGFVATQTGEGLEHALGEESALLEAHAELGDSIHFFTVATLIAAALVWWSVRSAASGKALAKNLTTAIAVFAVAAGVATTVQITRIGHSGAKTVWCEDSPSCAGTEAS